MNERVQVRRAAHKEFVCEVVDELDTEFPGSVKYVDIS